MKQTPLTTALFGPGAERHRAVFTLLSKQVWYDEKIRREIGFVQPISPSGQMMQRNEK